MAENISLVLSYDKNFWILINRPRPINEKKVSIKDEMNEAYLRGVKLVVALSQKTHQNTHVYNLELLKNNKFKTSDHSEKRIWRHRKFYLTKITFILKNVTFGREKAF